MLPFASLYVVGASIQHLRRYTGHILTVLVVDGSSFIGPLLTQLLCKEVACMVEHLLLCMGLGIPGHVHEQLDGIFHRLQVAHVENPHLLDAEVISQ